MRERAVRRFLLGTLLLLTSACGSDSRPVRYETGPDWIHGDETLRIGATAFGDIEKYGPSLCLNRDVRAGLMASGVVTGARTVEDALSQVIRDGLVQHLFGPRAGVLGGVAHDVVAGTVHGSAATIRIAGVPCVPFDLNTDTSLIILDLLAFPAHDGGDVVAIFLSGTLDSAARRPILDSIRVTP